MKIAIVSKFGHMECLGFLLESLKYCDISVFVDKSTDKFNWIVYFKKYYNFKEFYHLGVNINEFNHIIKLTSSDNCLYSENMISLLHINSAKDNRSKKFISLTPYVTGEDISYMFPIFKPEIFKTYNKNIVFVGYYKNSQIDNDTELFIKNNLDYNFTFILWGDNSYDNLTKHKNVTVLGNVETSNLEDIINNSKYVLSKKHINYDRFSGMLSLAMSFEKPIIIDSKTAKNYNIPGFIFNNNYNEIGKIDDISEENYNKIIDDIKVFNNNCISKNKEIIKKILDRNTVLLIEPRILNHIPDVIEKYYKCLPNWNFVFYCGKNTKNYWEGKLEKYVELRELDFDNFDSPSKYSFFLKQKNLWESLYGDYILTIQADTMIMSIEPYNIDYFIKLNKSYIGGNMNFKWNEIKRENINFNYFNFNGGLSLRKRKDMIKIIENFPPNLFNDETIYSSNFETDPEDVYFTLGCYKLGLPIGDDEESSYFAVHKIYKNAFFGLHQPCKSLHNTILQFHPELNNSYILN
jgi:hypothetical protein